MPQKNCLIGKNHYPRVGCGWCEPEPLWCNQTFGLENFNKLNPTVYLSVMNMRETSDILLKLYIALIALWGILMDLNDMFEALQTFYIYHPLSIISIL